MAKKKTPPRLCNQCGTRFRAPKNTCPRGPQCERDEANDNALNQRIKAMEKSK